MNENNFNNMNQNNNNQNNMQFNNNQFNQTNNQMNNSYGQQVNSGNIQMNNTNQTTLQNNGIVQPSSNPGYQVNNSFNSNYNSNQTYQRESIERMQSVDNTSNRKSFNGPIIVVVIVVFFCLIFFGCNIIFNLLMSPVTTKVALDTINEAELMAKKENAIAYFEQIGYYITLSSYNDSSVKTPTTKTGIVKCSKINSNIWQGEVLASSSSCEDFMNAVSGSFKGSIPTEGEVIFDKEGKVQDGSYLIYNNIICNNNNNVVACEKYNIKNKTITEKNKEVDNNYLIEKDNSYYFTDALEKYIVINELEPTGNYSVAVPSTKSGIVICTKNNEKWTGEVLSNSSSCEDFMNSVISASSKFEIPTNAKVIINKNNNNSLNGTWLQYGKAYCTYNNDEFICSNKKPE